MQTFQFQTTYSSKESPARLGTITTPHGVIQTPAFVPVGTQATVKSLAPEELDTLGVQLFFVNTYHAYLRPGLEVIKKFGGLHTLMHWDKPLITDSGGFQVFSLGTKRMVNLAISESAVLDREKFTKKLQKSEAQKEHVYPDDYRPVGELVKIDEDGVTFTSHWDGTTHRFTPERSIEIQHVLGADLIIAFDECTPYPATRQYAQRALDRTHRWAVRSLTAHKKFQDRKKTSGAYQALYGVVQGSIFEDMRRQSADFIAAQGFDGIAIGGVSVGESKKEMKEVCDWVIPRLPDDKPRHLLGVGEIDDIFDIVERGIDTFDCVQPTRLARMGQLFVRGVERERSVKRTVDITKKVFALDTSPVEKTCGCYTCSNFSRAYIHHLFRVRELLAYRLATIHNLHFVHTLVVSMREAIAQGRFLALKKAWGYNI